MQNDPQCFPDLRFSQLERYAKRWVEKFHDLPIKRILLCHYSSMFEEHYPFDDLIPQKYAIVFEFFRYQASPYLEVMQRVPSSDSNAGSFDPNELIEILQPKQDNKQDNKKLKKPTRFDEFICAIGVFKAEQYPKHKGLIDSGFTSVYNSGEKPKNAKEMTGEWHFTFSMPKDDKIHGHDKNADKRIDKPNANVRTDEDRWILYEARTPKKNTATQAKECLLKLYKNSFIPQSWKEILSHPEINKIMGHMGSEAKKREYLRPIVKKYSPNVCKGGAPTKKGTLAR